MITVSIIIVHYHADEELYACLESIEKHKPTVPFEIIVSDNDETIRIKDTLKKKFPSVNYVKSPGIGFGGGNNIGAKEAKGEYLFFLNPDTKVFPKTIDLLVNFLKQHTEAGAVAPLLLHEDGKPFAQQGCLLLTPIRGMVVLSFLNKLFPNNPISQHYWIYGWDKTKVQEVDVVPGTAFMIRKKLYDNLGGFDQHFFLYFEEFDLCKRIKEKGYRLFITPSAKVMHLWGKGGTGVTRGINKIYRQSRWYYFSKHYGLLSALLVEICTRFGRGQFFMAVILGIAAFLRFYHLSDLMSFIGDQGWFYLSARDMLLTGNIPLVGITASHTWLHQGPFWTYILAGVFSLAQFNPLVPGYFVAALGVITTYLVYKISSSIFHPRIGIFASLLYATSPFIILNDRMPYHTSVIPLFSLIFFYCLVRWIEGSAKYFPFVILCLTVLYNFELATASLWFIIFLVIAYGLYKKKRWMIALRQKKIVVLTILALVIPMLPMVLYDIGHGFPQTVKFAVWTLYHLATILGISFKHAEISSENLPQFFQDSFFYNQQFTFVLNGFVALCIILAGCISLLWRLLVKIKQRKDCATLLLMSLWLFVPLAAYLVNKTSSSAYLPVLFPSMMMMLAVFFDWLYRKNTISKGVSLVIVISIASIHTFVLLQQNYFSTHMITFAQRLTAAKSIVKEAGGKRYNIAGVGQGSQFASFTMNTAYLTWWLGNGPSVRKERLVFVVYENQQGIIVRKKE